jgi:hypothetical protein
MDGDLMDIRPYCKLKVIPGGSHKDSAYLSGVLFRKHVSHKRMAKEVQNPRIMLLSGGIEFNRMENHIAKGCHIIAVGVQRIAAHRNGLSCDTMRFHLYCQFTERGQSFAHRVYSEISMRSTALQARSSSSCDESK